uniref:Uncharacterized protein n=1 Tax=Avena sativa TaxID=4498 RepID=A0ACD5WCE1_AVESA
MAAPPHPRASPPALPNELVEEILLRLPPDDPACIIRASVVCKSWSSAVSHPSFRRRLHDLHRMPPVLGFLHNWRDWNILSFIPTTASAFSLAAPDRRFWRPLDCRHGRALFLSKSKNTQEEEKLLLWEPITGAQQHIPVPAAFRSDCPSAAVSCAVDGCDHRDCLGGPFRVVFVFTVISEQHDDDGEEYITSACVYSSETGTWGELTSMHCDLEVDSAQFSSVLVGSSLFYFLSDDAKILEYDLARHGLAAFDPPDLHNYDERSNIMLAEDGGLGVSQVSDTHLKLWSRDTDARWVLSRVIKLENYIPNDALVDATAFIYVVGFAEGANAIFVSTIAGIFMIDLQSERVMKVCDCRCLWNLIPIVSFYTPLPQSKHHGTPPSNPSEEATCKERGGDEEEAVEWEHQLFDKGSNAIQGGDSVNDGFSHAVGTRILSRCAWQQKTQEVNDPLDGVPKSVPNEESGTIAANKADVEDADAPSRKGDSEEERAGQLE